ncbi:MAG TPA: energy transducer TonB [Mucilaginibacter sp.]
MKKAVIIAILILTSDWCKAQYISVDKPIYKTVQKDTINIRGVLYDFFNNPVKYVQIRSKNKELVYYGFPIYTSTDQYGRFVLEGALVKDTLDIGNFGDERVTLINNGSRYLEIHLPQPKQKDEIKTEIKAIGDVTSKRIIKKEIPVFKVLTNANIDDYFGLPTYYGPPTPAAYVGGYQKFVNLIKSRVSYPEKAIENNIEGDVEIGFTIERDGSIIKCKVIKGIGYGCDDVVINAVKSSDRWVPARSKGTTIASQSSVTINFKLTDK